MFSSMGVELPFLTRLVTGTYYFSYPLIFGGGVILVIAKQFYVREKWANISTTFGAVLIVDFVSDLIVKALYRPLLDLIEKLGK